MIPKPTTTDLPMWKLAPHKWAFETKHDGVRAIITVTPERTVIRSRSGRVMTEAFPDVVEQLQLLRGRDVVTLDGEIVVSVDGREKPNLAASRAARTRNVRFEQLAHPARFIAFDVSRDSDCPYDLVTATYDARREWLETLQLDTIPHGGGVTQLDIVTVDSQPNAIWEAAMDGLCEGVVAKRRDSRYGTKDWLKFKPKRRISALVTGWEPGEGSRAGTIGALHLALLDANNAIVPIGKVGSGFDAASLSQVEAAINTGPMVVEVEYQEISATNGRLRFPVFCGIRTDVELLDCTITQLKGRP